MNKLWIFGDSFSAGSGIHPHNEYSKLLVRTENITASEVNRYSWQFLLSMELNLELKEYAISGGSNQDTVTSILQQINNFEKGDTIIIGWTFPHRISLPIKGWHQVYKSVSGHHAEYDFNDLVSSPLNELYIKFYSDAIIPQIYELSVYWNNILIELIKNLNSNNYYNVKTWNWVDLKGKFETITSATNGKLTDSHPSINGHESIYKVISKLPNGSICKPPNPIINLNDTKTTQIVLHRALRKLKGFNPFNKDII